MKKFLLLLAAVGMIFTACEPGGIDEENGGNPTEQPDDSNNGNNGNSGESIPNNEIWYTTEDNNIVELSRYMRKGGDYQVLTDIELFGANIVSHTYENGKGIIKCDGDITIITEAFCECTTLTNVIIPNSVISIGFEAFGICTSLTNITIPNSVIEIGDYAFGSCESLTSVTIPDSVTLIGEDAFGCCTSLKEVRIGNSVRIIDGEAFFLCTSLTSLIIPSSVTSIGDYAFGDCTSLIEVYCKSTTPPAAGNHILHYRSNDIYESITCKIYVPRNSVEAYKSAQHWSGYASDIVGYDF